LRFSALPALTSCLAAAWPGAARAPPGTAACTKEEVDAAYAGAHKAQEAWAKTPLHARCALLHKVAALMREHKAPMAHCLVKEIAKPAKDAMTEVVRRGVGRRRALCMPGAHPTHRGRRMRQPT
jgi:acyl-CoA reductase-like NAD-dependent aldehyde dehydrogenase